MPMSVMFPIDQSVPVKTKVFDGVRKILSALVQFYFYVYSSADREKKISDFLLITLVYHVKAKVYDYSNHTEPIVYTKVL